MKFQNKEIADMLDAELVHASFALNAIQSEREKTKNDPRFLTRFPNGDLPTNTNFLNLKQAISDELNKRGM